MTPHQQLIKHDPKAGQYGDCFRTAIACLLDIEPQSVPHFCEKGGASENAAYADACDWLRENHGLTLVAVALDGKNELSDILKTSAFWARSVHYLLVGTSKTGCHHNVICRNSKIVHDPNEGAGIVGPCDDGNYWITFLVKQL